MFVEKLTYAFIFLYNSAIMNVILYVIEFVHYSVCIGLIFIVLLQAGKSGGIIGAFGSGSSEQIFNAPSGIAFIKKVTIVLACLFMFTSLLLTKISTNVGLSLLSDQLSKISTSNSLKNMPGAVGRQGGVPLSAVLDDDNRGAEQQHSE
jgi:preprotein translocase subunit SecG